MSKFTNLNSDLYKSEGYREQNIISPNAIELYRDQPYIDFHFNNEENDFTHRIIASAEGYLNCTCSFSAKDLYVYNEDSKTFTSVKNTLNKLSTYVELCTVNFDSNGIANTPEVNGTIINAWASDTNWQISMHANKLIAHSTNDYANRIKNGSYNVYIAYTGKANN